MLPGQTVDQWQAAAPRLAQTFGVRQLRARRVAGRAQDVELLVTVRRAPVIRHVTEPPPALPDPETPAPRGAFPRQPRGGVS
jgi:hypothetical protein